MCDTEIFPVVSCAADRFTEKTAPIHVARRLRAEPAMASGTRPRRTPDFLALWQSGALVAWMLVAIGGVTAIGWWDSQRESEAVLMDVGNEQSVLASIAAVDLLAHLTTIERDALLVGTRGPSWAAERYSNVAVRDGQSPRTPERDSSQWVLSFPTPDGHVVDLGVRAVDLLGEAPPVERPGELRLLLAPPGTTSFYATDGQVLGSSAVRDALDRRLTSVRLSPSGAAELGLRPRTAMAGLAQVDAGHLGRWGVVAVGTAARPRDRESRAFWRVLLSVGMASALVLAFGGVALRKQRKELDLERELAVTHAQHERDDQLARAQRVATMGTFAMGMVHEVSTPLGVIMGRAEQLRARAQQDERSVHAAQAILDQVERIQTIVRRFLDLARGSAPSLARTRPADLVRSAVSSVEHRFAKARVSLSANAPADISEVHCDRDLLEHAIVNLLLNACDACPPGGHVEVAARSDAERVAFVVIDDGSGITSENASQAKEPFFTTKPAGAGTGLGLAIASEIAKSHRGELTVVPNGVRGTRACIEIPSIAQRGIE